MCDHRRYWEEHQYYDAHAEHLCININQNTPDQDHGSASSCGKKKKTYDHKKKIEKKKNKFRSTPC